MDLPKKQVLITGCYRTGSEYLTLLLSNCPKIVTTMYTTSFMRYCYNRYNPIHIKKNYSKLLKECKFRIKTRWKKNLNYNFLIKECDKQKKVSYNFVYNIIMHDLFFKKKNKDVITWVEKNQLVWRQIPEFLRMFKKGKSILIIRDPRSVLASFKKITYNPGLIYLSAIFNCFDVMRSANKLKKNFGEKILVVKFEDLLVKKKVVLKKIYKFLNLSFKNIYLREKNWIDSYGKKWNHNSAFAINKKFNKVKALNRWKNNLDYKELKFCEYINSKMMKKYNYNPFFKNFDFEENEFKIYLKNKKIKKYFNIWKLKKIGIQEFPNDPLNPKNWTEKKAMDQCK